MSLYDSSHTADVVIIGAGIVGASIANSLTQSGISNVILLEKEPVQGHGSTGKSMGGVRAQFSTAVNIQMSMFSIPVFENFEELTGHPSGYKPQGYLFIATSDDHMDYLRRNIDLQRAQGLTQVSLLTPDLVVSRVPMVRPDEIRGGSFCSIDGFVDPYSVMTGFTQNAVRAGARVILGATVTGITTSRGRVESVKTTAGSFSAPTVVNAAGPWAASVAQMAGAFLPVEPLRRMLVPTEPFPDVPENLPMVVDMATGFHFRPESRGLLLAWNDPEETPGFKTAFDPDFVEKILTRAVDRFPSFETLEVNPKRGWAGLYEVSPDHHAILGQAQEVEGLYYANGFSGHGVMHSPATGRVLADLITSGGTGLLDHKLLSVERFAEGRTLAETAIL